MRITIVQGAFLPVPPLLGGAVEKVWFSLGKEFARRGHQVVHVSRGFKGLPRSERIDGVEHRRVSGFSTPSSFGRRMLCDFWYAWRVQPLLPPADILVTNTFWLPALPIRRSRGRKYVHVARYPKGQMRLYRRAILQTVSEPIRQAILAESPESASRIRVISYPLSEPYLCSELPAPEKIILYTGRLHPEKGVHLAIEAFGRMDPSLRLGWRLKIVGPHEIAFGGGGDNYLAELKRGAAPLDGQVEFVGRVFDETKLIAHYRSAAAFVYPSLAERGETFGLAVLEAMASGAAPIVSDLACFRDFVRAEVNGSVFDHRTADPAGNLMVALTDLLTQPEVLNQIRRSAWITARDFTLAKITNQFLGDFTALIAKPPNNSV